MGGDEIAAQYDEAACDLAQNVVVFEDGADAVMFL